MSRVRRLWQIVRRIAGDDAYERYLAHRAKCDSSTPVLDRRAFYVAEQQRKWGGVTRCC